MTDKKEFIELFRKNGFNCFPIPKYPDDYENPKGGDIRYQASKTKLNQPISDNENYGVLPIKGAGTCIVDLDHKENYRKFAEENIANGYMVIESPNGWHVPIIGLSGNVSKIMLWDKAIEPYKQIVEIQGPDHYVIGCGSELFDKKKGCKVSYENKGSMKIWDAKGRDFHDLVDFISKKLNVNPPEKDSKRSHHKNLRERFKEGKVPTKGTSNDYFYNASIQCLTDGLPLDEAKKKIEDIYNKWKHADSFSGRPWSNIEAKIEDAYENGSPLKEGRPQGGGGLDRLAIAKAVLGDRSVYSDIETGEVYENTNGFLERITKSLQREVQQLYPALAEPDYKDIIFKLKGLAKPIPLTNKDVFAFKNGKVDRETKQFIETEDIADMGFMDYDYLPKTKDNEPTEFLKVMFGNIPEHEHPRIKAGLRSILRSRLDPRMSVIHGLSGVGKTTPLVILATALGDEYAMSFEFRQFVEDRASRAKIKDKRLVVFHDLPNNFKDFSLLKSLTGEPKQSIRGFHKDVEPFDNKIKVWASANYLAEIPEDEKDSFYSRRLSLIHNTRQIPYDEDDEFQEKIIRSEAEKIISWILNLDDAECKYEDRNTVRKEWEEIASPEKTYLDNYWEIAEDKTEIPVSRLVKEYQEKYQVPIPFDTMVKTLKSQGYSVKNNLISNIKIKQKEEERSQEKL